MCSYQWLRAGILLLEVAQVVRRGFDQRQQVSPFAAVLDRVLPSCLVRVWVAFSVGIGVIITVGIAIGNSNIDLGGIGRVGVVQVNIMVIIAPISHDRLAHIGRVFVFF